MKNFFLSSVVLFLIGCTQENTDKVLINIQSLTSGIVPVEYISDAVESYRFIPLETTTESLMSNIWKIIKKDNKFYISTAFDKKFYIFDNNGRFITKMDRIGGGPGEYNNMFDFDVCGDIIVVLDGYSLKFYTNDDKMKFIKSVDLDIVASNVKCINESLFCIYAVGDQDVFYVVDENGKTINSSMQANKATKVGGAIKFIQLDKNNFLLKYGYSNDLVGYNIDKNKFYNIMICHKGIVIDSEKEEEYLRKYPRGDVSEIDGNLAGNPNSTKKHTIFNFQVDKNIVHFVANKTQQPLYYINNTTKDDITYFNNLTLLNLINSDSQDVFISYLSPYILKESIEKNTHRIEEKNYQTLTKLFLDHSLNESNNPILIELYFKN